MAKAYTGVDIGTGHLKLAVCDGKAVSQIAIEEVPDNLVKDGRITSLETMSELLRDAVRKHRITAKNCALVLHARDVYTRRISLPAMTVDELKLNLPFEFRDYIADGKDVYKRQLLPFRCLRLSCTRRMREPTKRLFVAVLPPPRPSAFRIRLLIKMEPLR